jgi:signal-transduction protein with cAMP-binding, CBS, and nucleotidyltransferase domain
VPVLDDGRAVGIVSEADLLHTQRYPKGRASVPLRDRLLHPVTTARIGGRTARELMTLLPVAVGPDAKISEAAARLLHERVRRLLVVGDDGRLAGIVSRSDLLRAFLRDDEAIRLEIHEDVLAQELCMDPLRFRVGVRDGVVTLSGHVDRRAEVPLLLERVTDVEGVVRVDHQITAADDA